MNFLDEQKKLSARVGEAQAFDYIRSRGLKYLAENAWPTRKDEAWKYTSVKSILEKNYTMADLPSGPFVRSVDLSPYKRADMLNLVFVNGKKNETLSDRNLPEGLEILALGEALTKNLFNSEALGQIEDNFEALNIAFFDLGVYLGVAKEIVLARPINLIFVSENQNGKATPAVQPRIIINVGSGAKATVIETYVGESGASYFVNPSSEIRLAANSTLFYGRLQEDGLIATHVGRSKVYLQEGANFQSLVSSFGGVLGRHQLVVNFEDKMASAKILGVTSVNKSQHVDHQSFVDFKVGETTCEQIYKSVLSGQSRSVFNGRVLIRQDSQKVNSSQLNNNLLLSEQAEVDTKPQLEIYADDVKATHGATVGQLNQDELFYLESRAIPPLKAKQLLTAGFLTDLAYQWGDRSENQIAQDYMIERISEVSQRQRHEEA